MIDHARGQVAAQGDDAADAARDEDVQHLADAGAGGADAREMWRGLVALGGDFHHRGQCVVSR